VEEGPKDGVGETVVVAVCHFVGQVDGQTGVLILESFGDMVPVGLGNVNAFEPESTSTSDIQKPEHFYDSPGQPIQVKLICFLQPLRALTNPPLLILN
jgi:hypothetical protein